MALTGLALWLAAAAAPLRAQDVGGQVYVASTPDKAAILLNGQPQGVTPSTLTGIPPGRHLLVLTKTGYREHRRTIELSAGERSALDVRLERATALILIRSTPPGASVVIDNAERGQTPLLLTDLSFGRYRARLAAPGYLPKEVEWDAPDRTPVKVDVDLTANTATLDVRSNPAGASIILNGINQGTTPTSVERIPAGDSTIEISLQGYEPFSRTLALAPGQSETIDTVLTPIPSTLNIESLPAGARIYVDNQFRGLAPLTLEDLNAGTYRLRAEMQGFEPMARTIVIDAAVTVVEEFRLVSNSGLLEIVTEPAGVNVFIDGQPEGTTTAGTNATDRVSDPLTIRLLAGATHDVQLSKPGYFSKSVSVTLERDQTLTHHEELRRRFIPNYEVYTASGTIAGVLVEVEQSGDVRLEIRPGIFRTIPASDILSGRPLRQPQL